MAVPAEDALLDAPGAFGVLLQQFQVMIGFKQQNVGASDTFNDQFGGIAEVGKKSNVAAAGA